MQDNAWWFIFNLFSCKVVMYVKGQGVTLVCVILTRRHDNMIQYWLATVGLILAKIFCLYMRKYVSHARA